jgi:uncharacterized protein YlxP (DUF503 family)
MQVLAVRFELHLPQSRSLKARRAVLRPVLDGLRSRFRVSVAEVGPQDLHQRAAVGVAIVSEQAEQCVKIADEIARFVWAAPDLEVVDEVRTWTEFDE